MLLFKKIQYKIVKFVFQRRYKYFEYPFDSAEKQIRKMTLEEKESYYLSAKKFKESKVFEIEFKNIVKTFYQELATKASSDVEVAGYRLSLLFIQRLEQRLNDISNEYDIIIKSISGYKKYENNNEKNKDSKKS